MESIPALDELLRKLVALQGSDLHLKVGSPPAYRVDGAIHLAELPKLSPDDTKAFAEEVMTDRAAQAFEENNEADFAYGRASLGRFRVSVFRQRGSVSLTLRAVNQSTQSFDDLGLSPSIPQLAKNEHGLVVVTGRAGNGKSTTLGALLDYVNANRRGSIITLEDPIETLHADKLSIVAQREIGMDTTDFAHGIRKAVRQDPDVIMVSEMRGRDTVEAVLMAAESGHLVLTSMLTADATETVNRIVEYFVPHRRSQVRAQLAAVLRGVVSQRLVPRSDGQGRIPATEILVNYERVAEKIAEPESDVPSLLRLMVEGEYYGTMSFDQSLLTLYQRGVVDFQDAMARATDPQDFKLAAHALGLTA
jgi:twitching motility protein PilT